MRGFFPYFHEIWEDLLICITFCRKTSIAKSVEAFVQSILLSGIVGSVRGFVSSVMTDGVVGIDRHHNNHFKKLTFDQCFLGQILYHPLTLPVSQHILCSSYFQTAIRIGEATNPGPNQDGSRDFTLGFLNPTTVLHREDAINNLGVDCLALAETSATSLTQHHVAHNMKQRGYTVSWGAPVDNHKTTISGLDSLRGQASGVAFMAKVPLQPYRDQNIPTALQKTRVHFAYAQYGATTVLQCVLYGLSNGNERARETTNDLLTYVAEILLAHHGPAIVCGDFNHDLHTLPATQLLRQAGYTTILDLHQQLYGKPMPYTYKEQSTRDLMLFSTEITGCVTSIVVMQHSEFPGHKPIKITLNLPDGGLTQCMWKTPKNWQELQPQKELVARCYQQLPVLNLTQDTMHNLQQWSYKVEQAVDAALKKQHAMSPDVQPNNGLPSEYRGRFQSFEFVTKHFRSFAPKPRKGDYEPHTEVKTVKAAQLVRQLRRLQSLRRRLVKLRSYSEVWPRTWLGLTAEWKAILDSPGFSGTFTEWVCYDLQWPFLPQDLPSQDIVEALEEAVRSLVEQKLAFDSENHKKKVFVNQQIDHLFNYDRNSYSQLREPPSQFIQALRTEHVIPCQIQMLEEDFIYCQILGRVPTRSHMEFRWNHHTLEATCDADYILAINRQSLPQELSQEIGHVFSLTICYLGMQPTDIHDALEQYWKPIWQRDSLEQSTQDNQWEMFQQLLDREQLPPLVDDFDHTPIAIWKEVLKDSNIYSAPGSDGWYYQELAELPDLVVQDLIGILTSPDFQGFPSSHMIARVVSLPKKDQVEDAKHTRPITILPTLYRVWSAVITKIMLANAEERLDKALVGFAQKDQGCVACMTFVGK